MNKPKISTGLFWFFCVIAFCAVAHPVRAEVKVTAQISPSQISLDDEALLTVAVSGSLRSSDPVTPKLTGLDIVSTGHSTQIQIINGSLSTVSEYSYTIIPGGEGTFTIPGISVFAGGQEYHSNAVTLVVGSGQSGQTSGPIPPTSPQNPTNNDDANNSAAHGDLPFWITTSVSNASPYIGEQILFKFKLYTQENIETNDMKMPSFDGFLSEELIPEKRGNEVINGERYVTLEKVVALFPLQAGDQSIGETSLSIKYTAFDNRGNALDPFFGNNPFFSMGRGKTRAKVLRAPPIPVSVKALPEPQPQDFTGLVGTFGLAVGLSDAEVSAGDSTTLTIDVSGKGNIKEGRLPKLNFPDVKVYEDKPAVDVKKNETGITGKKTFKIALVPAEAGTLTIPAFTLSFFDPISKQYVPLAVDAQQVIVKPSADEKINSVNSQPQASETSKEIAYQDIAPLHSDAEDIVKPTPTRMSDTLFRFFVLGLPILLALLIFVRKVRPDTSTLSRKRGRKGALKDFQRVVGKSGMTSEKVLTALQNYFESVFDTVGKALTAHEMAAILTRHGVPAPVPTQVGEAAEALEAGRYGFGTEVDPTALVVRLKELLTQVQKHVA